MPVILDRLLQAHRFKDLCYQISEGIAPISIRDQMIRSQMLIDRILVTEEVPQGGKVLVLGGGPAGIATALRAAQWGERRGIETTLLEPHGLCRRIKSCTSRLISPTLYEWPSPSWKETVFPADSNLADMDLLQWSPGTGEALADQWITCLLQPPDHIRPYLHVRHPEDTVPANTPDALPLEAVSHLRVLDRDDAEKPTEGITAPWEPYEVEVTFTGGSKKRFHLVVFASGMGEERTWVGRGPYADGYWGSRFWDHDRAKEPFQGCSAAPHILISGGGDGALQDFLRLLTGKEPDELITAIEQKLALSHVWRDCREQIWQAEENERRIRHWAGDLTYDTAQKLHGRARDFAASQLQKVHEQVVEKLWETQETREHLEPLLQGWTENRLPARIVFVYTGRAFVGCYALNRFLALLINHFRLQSGRPSALFPTNAITRVECLMHTPEAYEDYRHLPLSAPHGCWGKPHRVTFKTPLPSDPTLPSGGASEAIFEIVILRHGIQGPDENHFSDNPSHAPYQLLPSQPDSSYWLAYPHTHPPT